jgi:hypothetical protein
VKKDKIMNKDYEPKEVFDYQTYLTFMRNKLVRLGKLDYLSQKQRQRDRILGIWNLSGYDPTPLEVQQHFDFVQKTHRELSEQYPDDEYLKFLDNFEEGCIIKMTTDWYKKYGIDK